MGDMKTPDFDDLLAAFDIPDMVDPKAAIESGHAAAANEEETHNPSVGHEIGVSVIVKNIRNVDPDDHVGPFQRRMDAVRTISNPILLAMDFTMAV
ncbi:unnamed protein product [Tetraodon nigroviridis]|uniref:(spotted green pufferfish) hypothetical protein n=1 Tax=Tetraodon nigroviridis TaxID=99883 RepID=Q4SQC9_TETNG|nr:unnamed protein product [Tetraodon nigroviridis]